MPKCAVHRGQEHPVNPTEILSEAVGQFAHRILTTSASAQLLNGRGSNLLTQGAQRLEEMVSVEIPQHPLVRLITKLFQCVYTNMHTNKRHRDVDGHGHSHEDRHRHRHCQMG